MAFRGLPARVKLACRASNALKALGVAVMALSSYASLTSGAIGPAYGTVPTPEMMSDQPTLTRVDGRLVITGSVSHLFESGVFAGPNQATKTDRRRPEIRTASLSQGFEQMWTQFARVNLEPPMSPAPASLIAALVEPEKPANDEPRISVASIDPANAGVAALGAIDGVAPASGVNPDAPAPVSAPQQLAYARDNLPVSKAVPPHEKIAKKELWCLATAIYFEARGESYRGQVAVAQVVMNRVKMSLYPSTICGVVFQNQNKRNACQFSFACDGIPETVTEPKAWAQAEEIAQKVVDGKLYLPEVGKASHYHASYVYPDWAPRLKRVTKIGMHIFYKFRGT